MTYLAPAGIGRGFSLRSTSATLSFTHRAVRTGSGGKGMARMGFSVGGCLLAGAGAAVTADGQVTLTNWGVNADLVATHQPDETGIPVAQDWQTGGLAVGDFNNDGCQDIFWVGGGGTADKLFINKCNGTGTFTEQGSAWGLTDLHCGNGVAVGDYDGDGRLDIYVTSFGAPGSDTNEPGQHRLYHNDGGSFSEVAGAAGVTASCSEASGNPAGYGAAWGDYDLDGSLDLCVVSWWGDDDGNRLYHNDGDGTFTDVTDTALGTAIDGVWGFQPAFVDMDGDRFPELLIASDFQGSRYFVNNGDGTFTDFTGPSGTGLDDNGMGQTVADVNNDGLFDWYVTSIYKDTPPPANPGNMLYLNLGDHQYLEISGFAGVNDGAWGWGTLAVDLDHDTWVDILEVNGRLAEPWANEHGRSGQHQRRGAHLLPKRDARPRELAADRSRHEHQLPACSQRVRNPGHCYRGRELLPPLSERQPQLPGHERADGAFWPRRGDDGGRAAVRVGQGLCDRDDRCCGEPADDGRGPGAR
jgi:hypothetical protein